MARLEKDIRELWQKASSDRPLVLIVDSLDSVIYSEAEAKGLDWLLDLPSSVKVIATLEPNSCLASYLTSKIDSQQIMKVSLLYLYIVYNIRLNYYISLINIY